MNKYLKKFPEDEQKFYPLFFDFVNAYNRFEHNLSIALSWVVSGGKPFMAEPLIEKLNMNDKIGSLKKLVNSKYLNEKAEMIADLNQWITTALKIKGIRNNYVHGRWQVLFRNNSDKFFFYSVTSASGKEIREYLSIDDFKEILADLEKTHSTFSKLYKKHLEPYTGGRVLPE